jgi:serine/threonine protein kinase
MGEANWKRYKQIRGKPLPETIDFRGAPYALARVFKRDFYAFTGLYRRADGGSSTTAPEQIVYKHYHTESLWFMPLSWLGRFLWRREMHFARTTADIDGIAHVLDAFGDTGMIREFIHGRNLREHVREHTVTARFFVEFKRILAEVHARGICHNDLNKEENILVHDENTPVLIDFQIALQCRTRLPGVRHFILAVIRYLQKMDRYHMLRHHVHYHPQTLSHEEQAILKKRGIILTLHAWLLRRPYRMVRRAMMRSFFMAKEAHS